MTRARALKRLIRARAAKTGERYTTARRHVLKAIRGGRAETAHPESPTSPTASRAVGERSSKGSVSDATSRAKTGHGLDHWFEVLDRFGGVEKGHTASARHLYDAHGVDGWYAQGITVAFERARGVRAVNQRRDGGYEVSVSKVLPVSAADTVKAFTDTRRRRRWAEGVDQDLVRTLSAAIKGSSSKGFVLKPNGQAHLRYRWDDTVVEVYIQPKTVEKSSIVAVNKKLSRQALVDERRAKWRRALNALATSLNG
jgi:hypothetical protein